jgi:PTH1 family peptidyl-tRNA hydrolase
VFLIVGLGNPGREHEANRHNVGFMVADLLREAAGWPTFKSKFSALWTRGEFGGQPVALVKPQTYMNLSGQSVRAAADFLKVSFSDIVVIHDELDLSWKDVRVKVGGGHAGHNGLRSIIEHLGTSAFVRVRVGIGKAPPGFAGSGADWVLSNFGAVEREELPDILRIATGAAKGIVLDGAQATMNRVNTRGTL